MHGVTQKTATKNTSRPHSVQVRWLSWWLWRLVSSWQKDAGLCLLLLLEFSIPVIIYPLITHAVCPLLHVSKYFPDIVQRYLGNLNLLSSLDLSLKYAPKIILAVPGVCVSHQTAGKERRGVWWRQSLSQEFLDICIECSQSMNSKSKVASLTLSVGLGEGGKW